MKSAQIRREHVLALLAVSDNAHTRSVPSEANSRVVSSFIDYLKVEKGLGALTVSAYTRDIGQFAAFLDRGKRTLMNARRDDVRGFLQQLFSNSVDGRSVARKLSALRHLYRFLLLDKRVDRDPTLNIPLPKQWKVLPKALGRDEVETMLRGDGPLSRSKFAEELAIRNRAMIEVFYAGALRVSEITSLKLEDVKLDMGYVLVRGKGDKERIVPMGRSAQGSLTEYFRDARPKLAAGKIFTVPLHRARCEKAHAAARLADGGRSVGGRRAPCQPAHAAPQLRHSYGRKRCRSAHRADHPRPRRHFDHADLHARRARSFEERLCETSSTGEGEITAFTMETRRHGENKSNF